jgi:glycosyltransferase involved in cell wall biosynthesis
MHIAIVSNSTIPALKYGGIERVIWWLGKELVKRKYKVTYIVNPGSRCDFATVQFLNKTPLHQQIPDGVDVVHYQSAGDPATKQPYLTTIHGNINELNAPFDINCVALSANHAKRMNTAVYVYNGIDFDDYGKPDWKRQRKFFHFLGDAAWKVKNLKGAIKIAKTAEEKLAVIGGSRIDFNHGVKINFSRNARFYGRVGGDQKNYLLNESKGLIFPVLWHEPFGLALIESLYFGCPVFGSPYGSLPELINPEVGFLSGSYSELAEAIKNVGSYDQKKCHDYVVNHFSSSRMAEDYIKLYERIAGGGSLNASMPHISEVMPKYLPMKA